MKTKILAALGIVLMCKTSLAARGGEIAYRSGQTSEEPGLHFGKAIETSREGGANRRVINYLWLPLPYWVSKDESSYRDPEEIKNLRKNRENNLPVSKDNLCDQLKVRVMKGCFSTMGTVTSECYQKSLSQFVEAINLSNQYDDRQNFECNP